MMRYLTLAFFGGWFCALLASCSFPTYSGFDGADAGAEAATQPSCTDRRKDGLETDIDCGGTCTPCALDRACQTSTDCLSGACKSSKCTDPMEMASCSQDADCSSHLCIGGKCQISSCDDTVKNGAESDID